MVPKSLGQLQTYSGEQIHTHNMFFVVEETNLLNGHHNPAKQDVNSLTGQYKSGVSQQQMTKALSKQF